QSIAIKTMNTSSDRGERQEEVDSYDDNSFYKQHKGPGIGPKEPAGANDFPADKSRGFNFSPFIVQPCNYYISYLPNTLLNLSNFLCLNCCFSNKLNILIARFIT
ncbi:hypothetical protein FOC4_g10010267, partial [Fusarium odoratissimum]